MDHEFQIDMPYIGGVLSDNSYKFQNRKTKPPVAIWKRELANKVEALSIPKSNFYLISIFGYFTDQRHPDLSNLHKVIGDSIKMALSTDDKFYRFNDLGVELGTWDPYLIIFIDPKEKDGPISYS